jgi:hypothetical protein
MEAIAMRTSPGEKKASLKSEMVWLLDQFLLGYISSKDLISGVVPMLMLSQHKRGRKNYIEKYLMEIAGKTEQELTREYVYKIRETIKGEVVTSEKDRSKVFRRTLRKLVERFMYDEIEEPYYLSMLSDLMIDFHKEIQAEPEAKRFFDNLQILFSSKESSAQNQATPPMPSVMDMSMDFYESYFKGLWDE